MRLFVGLWLASLWLRCLAEENNETQPISIFRSRPDLIAPILTIFNQSQEKQAPGYYFIAPYQQRQESVHIFDNDANLVWTGFGGIGPGICHAPQTCQYNGETHLCFYQGTQMTGWGHGHGVVLDKHYRVVKSVETGNYQASSDMHEFRLTKDGKSALMTQFIRSVYDLCPWDLCDGLGYINEGAFQEVDVETGKLIFDWKSLDHIDTSESFVGPGTTEISGSGEEPASPWDYFHINSVDKNEDGDYLISARHTSAVYKISGKDGHVMWRLNGAKSDYRLDGFSFSSQHDARWVSDNEDETVISLFDNASNGFNITREVSTGQIIKMNHKTKVATALLNLGPPIVDGHGHSSRSQGSFQILPNGNYLLGWGNDAFWTEYTKDGEIVFYGAIGWENVMNYRVHKFDDWVGLPLTKPALWAYSKHGKADSAMHLYVSWNGATEVRQWNFYSSNYKKGPWEKVASVAKSGFETTYRHKSTMKYTYAEAIDAKKQVLGTSEVQQTFVPDEKMHEYCDELACRFMPSSEERQKERDQRYEAARQKEAAEREAKDAAREREMQQERKREKQALILARMVEGLITLVIITAILSTRNFISRPVRHVAIRVWDAVSGNAKRKATHSYKALSLEDQDGDRPPMIMDGK